MSDNNLIDIEVLYALIEEQLIFTLKADAGITVKEAIDQSDILIKYPEIDLSINKVGVFGKACKLDTVLNAGDRVEIYRKLIADPKEARKQRAAKGKDMKKRN